GPTARSASRRPRPPSPRSRSSLAGRRPVFLGHVGEEDPVVGRIRGGAHAGRRGRRAPPARREPFPDPRFGTGDLRLAHLGSGRAGLRAVGLTLALGLLLGAAQVVAAPPIEPVVPGSTHRLRRWDVDRPNDRARTVRSVRFIWSSRRLPSATALPMVRNVVLDSSMTSPALLTMRQRQSGRAGVENAITGTVGSSRGFRGNGGGGWAGRRARLAATNR